MVFQACLQILFQKFVFVEYATHLLQKNIGDNNHVKKK